MVATWRQWLSTKDVAVNPLNNPQTDRERRYNDAHSCTRSVVERAIGQLKCRWRCLDRTGGMLLYHPDKVCRIILACGVLHNVAHRHGIPLGENSMRQDAARWTGFSTGGNIRDTRDAGLNGLWLLGWCGL
ncbi:hypothetical protein DPEC_G00005940 [Dallia pectoralis]|uniref:Uncharacterized protein n=1 Tax=Dallia pectoralis TaxID=75939 RepID=A0ACC2HKN3_DALPE|nr:hypothetical protein DPEC_G00005940 [Dallia pectoralis]